MAAPFQPESLRFLRGLVKHNDREWFEARRAVYERALKAPMLALIEEINHALESFAPGHVRPAHKCMMRIYRDIRFSKDKRPYKQHVGAWWSRRGMEKTSGGGFYLQIGAEEVLIAAGVYMPGREQLLAIRRWMGANHDSYRTLVKAAEKQPRAGREHRESVTLTGIEPEALSRMPKGFAADDPAGELLRAKNWGVRARLPAATALEPHFGSLVARVFRHAHPVVAALNDAILARDADTASGARKPLF